jgi:predicted NAD/FAD-dependent oxidoreductase
MTKKRPDESEEIAAARPGWSTSESGPPRALDDHEHSGEPKDLSKSGGPAVTGPWPRIAMIGSGLAGLMCSRVLYDHGHRVVCFDKSNRVGGRTCTRAANSQTQFDHGAQYFTIRDPILLPHLESWRAQGHVKVWEGCIVSIDEPGAFRELTDVTRFVGSPKMENLAQNLSKDLAIELNSEVSAVELGAGGYRLTSNTNQALGEFDIVLWNCPPAQVEALLPYQCHWRTELASVEMEPCWAVMLGLENRWNLPIDGAFINLGSLGWIARDSSKPHRPQQMDSWVLHSTKAWAAQNLDTAKETVIAELIQEVQEVTNHQLPKVAVANAHRWRYSKPKESLKQPALWDDENWLGACGDWCGGPRVEGAIKSGKALAEQVMRSLL